MFDSRITRYLPLVLVVFLLAGCAKEPKARIFWPPPPETPRLEFIGVYASERDFIDEDKRKFSNALLGERAEAVFRSPYGIVSDDKGTVYISDQHMHNIRVYDFNRKHVEFYNKRPSFSTPMGLALDAAGNLYVADAKDNAVKVFTPSRQPLRVIGSDLLNAPTFMAINESLGRLYVSSSKGNEVVVFDLAGSHLFSFGEQGIKEGQFYSPQGLAIDADGNLFVADRLNARIQVFDADGNFQRAFGERGDQYNQFEAPKDLAFDSEGNLHVIDQRRGAFYTYSPEGEVLLVTGGDKRDVTKLGFAMPTSIFIGGDDRIYIADMLNKRFSIWQYLSEAYLQKQPVTEEDLERTRGLMEKEGGESGD